MPGSDIFDKLESYLKQQEETYGSTLFFDKSIQMEEKPEAKDIKLKKAGSEEFSFHPLESPEHAPDLFTEQPEWMNSNNLDELYQKIHNCKKCPLGESRNKFVFGSGSPTADIMVIGEAPGRDEDLQGEPFVGRAGQLLTKILESINLKREYVFIGNIIKCRPPNNRRPSDEEVSHCEPYLMKQIELIKPAFILALGLTAVDTLLKSRHKMADIRGDVLDYHGIKMLVTYHPAALLRNPNLKKAVWEDMKKLRKMYDEYLENK